jgi:hypothetical protein
MNITLLRTIRAPVFRREVPIAAILHKARLVENEIWSLMEHFTGYSKASMHPTPLTGACEPDLIGIFTKWNWRGQVSSIDHI